MPQYWATVEQTLYGSREGRLRAWTPRELVALVAGEPQGFRAGSAWSYSNTGYILLGLIVEAATGVTLAEELDRAIFGPLGLRDSLLPGNEVGIPPPRSRGYSLPLGPPGPAPDGPLLDFTDYDPSWAWAAGGLVSTLEELTRFFRALLGGRLLPPRLLTEMLPTVTVPPGSVPLPLYDRYGLGPGGRDAGRAPGRQRRRHPRLPEHRPQHQGRPPPAEHHDQRAARPRSGVRGVHPGIPGARRWLLSEQHP